ncbi:MAG: aromatic amino acid ammonia-lyase [Candidatus Doudnabacteria bacterium]|nr:aromatic amino acid ammonia-lyase [Candidatus Doudnabacteria bacterium]
MKSKSFFINGHTLNPRSLATFTASHRQHIEINSSALNKAEIGHRFLADTVEKNNRVIYGINTGFGPMANYILAHGQIEDLQKNLILSHAAGLGEKLPDEYVLAAMVVRLNTLVLGHSGVSPELLKRLEQFINLRIIPVVPKHGAVGTSGDLVQLAHIALAIIGQGEVVYKNQRQKTAAVLKQLGIKPYKLKPKEGLALINGTAMMTGIAALLCVETADILSLAVRNGCLALELVKAYSDSFGPVIHQLRPHPGQSAIAKTMRTVLANSQLIRNRDGLNKQANQSKEVHKISDSVQEFYSMRCLAQVLGPAYDTLSHTWKTTEIEVNSVTDNPIVDWEHKTFLHGGNFHGDYIAVAMDQLKMSLVKLTMLSERRLNFFLNNKINQTFPPFLNLDTPGLTLGLQGLQFVATSTTAHSQTLAYPMNLHSIPTNGDNQDIVSMGSDAALLTGEVLENARIVLGIELFALCQAVDFLKVKNRLSKQSRNLYGFVRENAEKVTADRSLSLELQSFLAKLKTSQEINLFKKF